MNRLVAMSRKSRKCGFLVVGLRVGLMFCLAGAHQMRAQVVGGTIVGTITDPSAGVVPRAHILIRNLANGTTRNVETDAAGFYTAPNLPPGIYEVDASATGFATKIEKDITVAVKTGISHLFKEFVDGLHLPD